MTSSFQSVLKLYSSTTTLDSTTLVTTVTPSGSLGSSGGPTSTLEASKEYGIVVTKDSRASTNSATVQIIVLRDHLTGGNICNASASARYFTEN